MESKKDFILKFTKFNIVGMLCFLFNTLLFGLLAPYDNWIAWIIANLSGGIMSFFIYYWKVNIHKQVKNGEVRAV